MKKYVIQYENYDEILGLLGHEIPHHNVSNVKTLVVDLTEEEYEALVGAGINVIEEQIPRLCYSPSVIPFRGLPSLYNPLNDFLKVTQAHLAGHNGAGVNIALMDTGCNDSGLLSVPSLIRQDYTGTGVQDDINHGGKGCNIIGQTHSAIAPNGSISYGGIANGSQLYSMKVYTGFSGITPILNAISWSISNGINIINISIDFVSGLTSAINAAMTAGIIVVCASGNSTLTAIAHPANIPGVVAVNGVDYASPTVIFGSYLYSVPEDNRVTITTYNGGSAESFLGGTSQCAYHVTGLLAIYKQKYPSLDTPKAIKLLQRKALEMDGYTYDIESDVMDKLLNYQTGAGFMAPLN